MDLAGHRSDRFGQVLRWGFCYQRDIERQFQRVHKGMRRVAEWGDMRIGDLWGLLLNDRYFYGLAGLDGLEDGKTSGYARQQLFEGDGLRAKDDHRDVSASEILLVTEAVIHGQQDVKAGGFRGVQELSVLESTKTGVSGRLHIVVG